MKLSQYKEKKKSKKIIIVAVAIIFLIGGMILEKTFANFKVQKSFKVMEGNFIYEGSGDVMFAFYKDNQEVTSIPTLEEGYVYEKSECNNKASIEWNNSKWAPLVTNLTMSKTKCDIYFKKGSSGGGSTISSDYNALADLVEKNSSNLMYDLTNEKNLRFVGVDPNNYVDFNNEYIWRGHYSSSDDSYREYNSYEECTSASSYNYNCEQVPAWRIIGVMNNIEDENGDMGSHLKIIRESIGEYSWDSSSNTINQGYGVNEWSEADIQKVLNENYYQKNAGGICYLKEKEYATNCPAWENIGLDSDARNMVSKVKWNTGTFEGNDISSGKSSLFYEAERSQNIGKTCRKNAYDCSDEVDRKTYWLGYVGLMYPSDYMYATNGGGDELARGTCLGGNSGSWTANCIQNDWLNDLLNSEYYIYFLTPKRDSASGSYVYRMSYGKIDASKSSTALNIRPVVYLNSNVKIEPNDASDYGSITNPYKLTV